MNSLECRLSLKKSGYRNFSVPNTEVRFISIAFTGVKKDCIIQLI